MLNEQVGSVEYKEGGYVLTGESGEEGDDEGRGVVSERKRELCDWPACARRASGSRRKRAAVGDTRREKCLPSVALMSSVSSGDAAG